ncbi:hypothetical protein Poli38472_008240 [Pythium oligandrum]|uniref:Cytochrome P450 n=1 Tax=Pythium oligandrum TaxID=41045 RepID=A0A8K1CMF5_PYTOL|nr:hypothetical protein Poli38472_008240 [Pythium oligandrum]|eukprot:TMW65598.1 hypothetical protein Poli38472_008240 [Pythium oligandrum]
MDQAASGVSRRFTRPEWISKLQHFLNFGDEAKLAANVEKLHIWLGEIIHDILHKHMESRDDAKEVKSIIELFLEYNASGEEIPAKDLVTFIQGFVGAARDTTALTLGWFFYLLDKHPDVETKIREEIKKQLPDLVGRSNAYLALDHTRHLVYLEAALKETLRLYPAAPFLIREAACDKVICGDVLIRKGQSVGLSIYAMARNPDVWGPDAAVFKPERWIDPKTGEIIQVPTAQFFSFSTGPRSCLGMNLAMLELRAAAANLINWFRFGVNKSNDGSYVMSVVLPMKQPLLAKVSPAFS